MKRVVILLVFILLISNVSAKEISIPELFEVEGKVSVVQDSGKEVYYYAGSKLIAVNDEYKYEDRLGSDLESRGLPFGQALDVNNRFSFTGKELDQDLYYFNARYYSPELGKFTSVDPVRDNHAYGYVMNNPMNLIDPTGMEEGSPRSEVYQGIVPYTLESNYRPISDPLRNTMRRMLDPSTLPRTIFEGYTIPPDTLNIVFTNAREAVGANFDVAGGYKSYQNELILGWEVFSWPTSDTTREYGPTLAGIITTIHEFSHFLEHPGSRAEEDTTRDIDLMMTAQRFSIPEGGVADFIIRMERYFDNMVEGETRAYDLELKLINFLASENWISAEEKIDLEGMANSAREIELNQIAVTRKQVMDALSGLE